MNLRSMLQNPGICVASGKPRLPLTGLLCDARRLAAGALLGPSPTRSTRPEELAAARACLEAAGCNLGSLTIENLHVSTVDLDVARCFDIVLRWEHWPVSSFHPCREIRSGVAQVSYKWYHFIRMVSMEIEASEKPFHVIYRITGGIGAGGYHAFLLKSLHERTRFSIYTVMSEKYRKLFPEGFHDWMNYDACFELRLHSQSEPSSASAGGER